MAENIPAFDQDTFTKTNKRANFVDRCLSKILPTDVILIIIEYSIYDEEIEKIIDFQESLIAWLGHKSQVYFQNGYWWNRFPLGGSVISSAFYSLIIDLNSKYVEQCKNLSNECKKYRNQLQKVKISKIHKRRDRVIFVDNMIEYRENIIQKCWDVDRIASRALSM